MKKRTVRFTMLLLLVALMFMASGLHGSYFCVSPWGGDGPVSNPAAELQR